VITSERVGAVGRIVVASVDAIEAECLPGCSPPPVGALLITLDGDPPAYAAVTDIRTAGVDPSRPVVPHGGADEDLETVLHRNPHLPMLLRVSFNAPIIAHGPPMSPRHFLPEAPPPLLARVAVCGAEQIARFVEDLEFLDPLVRSGAEHDEMIAWFLRRAADASADGPAFLLAAGRRLVSLLGDEPERLVTILRRIRP
jgi:hypothetical protein